MVSKRKAETGCTYLLTGSTRHLLKSSMCRVSWAPYLTQFSVSVHQKCCNITISISEAKNHSLFKISKRTRLFLNHPFTAFKNPLSFFFLFFLSTNSQGFGFWPKYSLATGQNWFLYFLNFLQRITLCCLGRGRTYPAIWKLEKLAGAMRRSLALQFLTVLSQRKTMEKQRGVLNVKV